MNCNYVCLIMTIIEFARKPPCNQCNTTQLTARSVVRMCITPVSAICKNHKAMFSINQLKDNTKHEQGPNCVRNQHIGNPRPGCDGHCYILFNLCEISGGKHIYHTWEGYVQRHINHITIDLHAGSRRGHINTLQGAPFLTRQPHVKKSRFRWWLTLLFQ